MEKSKAWKKEFEKWLKTRPPEIRKMAKRWPPDEYVMKRGAPYGIAVAGTPVTVYSYNENGTISVIIKAKDKKKQALEHEEYLCLKYQRSPEDLKAIHKTNVLVNIDPVFLGKKK